MPQGDIAKNGRRFGEHPVAVDERRHAPFRVDAKIFRAILLVGGEIDARKLERRADLLERNVRGERARARGIVKLHRLSLFASLPINKSSDRRPDPISTIERIKARFLGNLDMNYGQLSLSHLNI